jgi:hypothetical protein
MAESATFPFKARLNIFHSLLEIIDIHAVPGANDYKWFNQTLAPKRTVILMVENAGSFGRGTEATDDLKRMRW